MRAAKVEYFFKDEPVDPDALTHWMDQFVAVRVRNAVVEAMQDRLCQTHHDDVLVEIHDGGDFAIRAVVRNACCTPFADETRRLAQAAIEAQLPAHLGA